MYGLTMNTTRKTNSLASTVGNIAAYIFWLTAAASLILGVASLIAFDTPAAFAVGQACAVTLAVMLGSVLAMGICYPIVKEQEAR